MEAVIISNSVTQPDRGHAVVVPSSAFLTHLALLRHHRPMPLDHSILTAALEGLEAQKARIEAHISSIRNQLGIRGHGRPATEPAVDAAPETEPKRRRMSASTRKRMAAAQKKRWATRETAAPTP